jgi:hypothetical protein
MNYYDLKKRVFSKLSWEPIVESDFDVLQNHCCRNFDKALEALKRNHTQLERILKGVLSLNHEDDVQELLDDAVKLGNAIKELETIEE